MTLSETQAKGLKATSRNAKAGQPTLIGVSLNAATAKALEARGLVRISGQYVHITDAGLSALD